MANEVIIPVKYVVDDSGLQKAGQKIGALTAEEKKLEAEMNDVANAAKRQATEFHKAGDAGVKAAKDTEKQYNMLGNSIGSIGGIIAGVFAVDQLLSFGKAVLTITAEFQKYKAVLTNSLGSANAAASAMAMIQEIAAKTPFSVATLTESYVKLVNQGFKPTAAQLISMGDLAASTGKEFDQLAEAILDAQTGEFERLKEFGVRAKKEGENITFTFKGIETTVKNTSTEIQNYLVGLGQIEGVSGSMAAISETLGGKISNLGDAFDQLFITLGEGVSGPGVATIDFINKLTKGITILLTDPVAAAQKQAASTMTDFEANMVAALQGIADKTKAAGGNVEQAISTQLNAVSAKLTADLKKAQSDLKSIQENIDSRILVPHTLKTALAETSGRVTLLTGQLESLKGIADKVRKDGKGEDVEKLGTIEKIELKIKELTEARRKDVDLTQAEADNYKLQLFLLQEKLDKLTKINYEQNKELDFLQQSTHEIDALVTAEEEGYEKRNKAYKDYIEKQMAGKTAEIKAEKDKKEEIKELDDEETERKKELVSASFDLAAEAANAFMAYQSAITQQQMSNLDAYYQHEIQGAGDNAVARAQLEEEYQRKKSALLTKQAKQEQNQALFNIALSTAEGITRAVMKSPETFGMPFSAFVAVTGAIQAALVKATPIPKFAKGTRSVMGGTPGEDSVLAMLMPGERVVTTEKNRQLSPALDVLTDSKRSPQFWNKTLMEIEKLGMFSPPKLTEITRGAMGNSLDTDRIVAAVRGIVIEKTIFDERGVVRYTEKEVNRIRKLNKRYGF